MTAIERQGWVAYFAGHLRPLHAGARRRGFDRAAQADSGRIGLKSLRAAYPKPHESWVAENWLERYPNAEGVAVNT